jgi:hypothetical protein
MVLNNRRNDDPGRGNCGRGRPGVVRAGGRARPTGARLGRKPKVSLSNIDHLISVAPGPTVISQQRYLPTANGSREIHDRMRKEFPRSGLRPRPRLRVEAQLSERLREPAS